MPTPQGVGQKMAGGFLRNLIATSTNSSNHSQIFVHFFLLFDDRPSPRSFARFRSSPFGAFSLVGRCRDQFAISGNPCQSP